MLKGSKHILQESSEPSSKAAEEDGAKIGGISEREGAVREEEQVKSSIDSSAQ